jgi:hypothetical protein
MLEPCTGELLYATELVGVLVADEFGDVVELLPAETGSAGIGGSCPLPVEPGGWCMSAPEGAKKFCTPLKFPDPVPVGVAVMANVVTLLVGDVLALVLGGVGGVSLGGVENVPDKGVSVDVAAVVTPMVARESAFCIIITAAGSITVARLSSGLSDWETRTKSSPAATSSQTKSIGREVGIKSLSPSPAILAQPEKTFSPVA